MSAFDALAYVVGEGATYLVGRVVGRVFQIERDRSLKVGQWLVIGALAVGGFALCLVYT
jgi:hypothetical protein